MQCRPPRKIKRYLTEPEQLSTDNRNKYSNLNRNQLKLQVSAIETLKEISVPALPYSNHNTQKASNSFMPLHPKFHLRRNPLKKLPDLNTQNNSNNGCDIPNIQNGPQMFKRNNPLFVVNSLFDILKQDLNTDQTLPQKIKKNIKEKRQFPNNQFSQFDARTIKFQRGPKIIESQLSRLTQQSKFSRRKIYSEEKSRQKVQQVELLTFYKPKPNEQQDKNQFLS